MSSSHWSVIIPLILQRSYLIVFIRQGNEKACCTMMTTIVVLQVFRINEYHWGGWKGQKMQIHKKEKKIQEYGPEEKSGWQSIASCPAYLNPNGPGCG